MSGSPICPSESCGASLQKLLLFIRKRLKIVWQPEIIVLIKFQDPAPGHSQGLLRAPCARRRGCGLMASRFLLVLAYELK